MFKSSSVVLQLIVVSFLLGVVQYGSAVRFSRSLRYIAPPMRKYYHPWRYVPFSPLPRSMQRRFMWREMDDTVDELVGGVANGARAMTQIFTPSVGRYRKPNDYDSIQSTTKVKYVMKKPPPRFKRMKVVKYRAPKKSIPIFKPPIVEFPSGESLMPSIPSITSMLSISSSSIPSPSMPSLLQPKIVVPMISEEELRKIEKEQEKRVEGQDNDGSIHEHSHQTHLDDDVVSGRINEFGQGWLPIQTPFSTSKPFPRSRLHTKVEIVTVPTTSSSPSPFIHPEPKDTHSYEVTEHSAEESVKKEQTFKPMQHFNFVGPTTERPNYPDFFLRSIQKGDDEEFKPKRIHTPAPMILTTSSTTPSTTTLSHRLPPRSTTERPFKRYNLHRPKSSKLFFNRPTSSSEPARPIQTSSTTTEAIKVISAPLPVIQEPIRTTRETIKTTRESIIETRPAPTEKVRIIRNDQETKIQTRIKSSSRNEELSKLLNRSRGTVKFGEKKS